MTMTTSTIAPSMRAATAIGTYIREGRYGVWMQVNVEVAGRPVPIDVEVTPPTLDTYDARHLARELHDQQTSPEGCELLLMY